MTIAFLLFNGLFWFVVAALVPPMPDGGKAWLGRGFALAVAVWAVLCLVLQWW